MCKPVDYRCKDPRYIQYYTQFVAQVLTIELEADSIPIFRDSQQGSAKTLVRAIIEVDRHAFKLGKLQKGERMLMWPTTEWAAPSSRPALAHLGGDP